jgi:hypothetical protein
MYSEPFAGTEIVPRDADIVLVNDVAKTDPLALKLAKLLSGRIPVPLTPTELF